MDSGLVRCRGRPRIAHMKILLSCFFATSLVLVARGADPALHTEVRLKETAPRSYLCLKKELKIAQMGEFAVDAITQLVKKATELKLGQGGPVMFTYFGFQGDPEQTFTAEIGLPVHKTDLGDAAAPYIRKAPKFKCASAIFQGPLTKIGEAWHSFALGAMAKGEPTGESRELHLYFEAPESPNNIVELQMVLK